MTEFQVLARKTVYEEELIEPQLWQLSIQRGEVSPEGKLISPSKIIFIFRGVSEDGTYRDDVEAIRGDIEDDLNSENPILSRIATIARQAIIDAVVPDVEPYTSMGLSGLAIRDAGPVLLQMLDGK